MPKPDDTTHAELEQFLAELQRNLAPLPESERNEIIREARSHLLDRIESGAALLQATTDLGGAARFAQRFVADYRVEEALASGSTWRMFRTAGGLLGRGTFAFLGFLVLLVLFSSAIALVFIALLKPFVPEQIGLWTSPGFVLGFTPTQGTEEHLGWWIIPFGLVSGGLLYLGASRLLRVFLRRLL